MKLKIQKPDDSNEYYNTTITCANHRFNDEFDIRFDRSAKDPIQAGLEQFWRGILSPRNKPSRYYRQPTSFKAVFNHVVMINGCPVSLIREGIRYQINGKSASLSTVTSALARVTFKSCFEDDPVKLLQSLYATLELPENVKYCLENRAPFHFIENYEQVDVRLNVQQIGDNEMAMEISDGVWGTLTVKQLDTFCNYYLHGRARGSWKRLSSSKLYERLIGREPTDSELTVMKAFLKQNRTQDLVDSRALELIHDLVEQHEGRLVAHYSDNGELETLYVRGTDFDWKLTANAFKSDIQMVSTFIWQPNTLTREDGTSYSEPLWKGPICIDNMAKGSPIGDQFAGRALALLNDSFTIKIVNTIRSYISAEPNEYRNDKHELQ